MAFFTRLLPRLELRHCLALCALLLSCAAWSAGIVLDQAEGLRSEDRLSIDARFHVSLNSEHENALLAGVPLTFVAEFTLTQPRWYWAYRRVADWFDPTARYEIKLSYHALTRQYRVGVGSLYRSFDTLGEALGALGVIRDWGVHERGGLSRKLGSHFGGQLLIQLDTSKLPKPLQLSLLGEGEWKLASEPQKVEFPE